MFKSIISLLLFITICSKSFSQNDSITINQDPKLLKVMELKKIVNQEAFTSGQFTIQIFSGNYTDYKILMDELKADDKYDEIFYSFETPYYKIRLGKYVSRIFFSNTLFFSPLIIIICDLFNESKLSLNGPAGKTRPFPASCLLLKQTILRFFSIE